MLLSVVVEPVSQNAASMALCVELLSVLNNCGPAHGDVASSLLQVALQWIESSPMSVLLLPIMLSACQCLASTSHMVRVVETCCDTYFCRGMSLPVSSLHDDFPCCSLLRAEIFYTISRCRNKGSFELTFSEHVMYGRPFSKGDIFGLTR